ncbi:hypothetical protein [Nocardioides sp. L-11A]|uniref:flavodoxin family protein n=1 Tax=Nocardioides sp. L-11A TaxID=3043848 RepID=UPI00249B0DA1|nr:hypothetical protein QJ852_18335 [Nocardioides sp. L-11A]
MSQQTPSALVVYESLFGNTALVARAIVRGLRAAGLDAHRAPVSSLESTGSGDIDLLMLGAPTHAFSLSRPRSRSDAVRQGAPPDRAESGAREWIRSVSPDRFGTSVVVVFDTRVAKVRRWPLAAGRTAGRLLRRRGFHLLRKPEAFLVDGVRGPLSAGEEERAEHWGQTIGAAFLADQHHRS